MTSQSVSKNIFNNQRGFSFVTILLMMVAIALVSSALFMAVPPGESTKAADVTQKRATRLQAAIKIFKNQNAGAAPLTLNALFVTTGTPCSVDTNISSSTYRALKGWCGPYIDRPVESATNEFLYDGWGVLFQYDQVTLKSCGPNKICGDGDDLVFSNF